MFINYEDEEKKDNFTVKESGSYGLIFTKWSRSTSPVRRVIDITYPDSKEDKTSLLWYSCPKYPTLI